MEKSIDKLLEFKNVTYLYNSNSIILKDINISFDKGKFYTIVGPSGSGKTTFLSLAAGLDKNREGQILYNDIDLSKVGLSKYRNKYVSIIFQGYNLLPYMTALQNIISAMEIKGIKERDNKKIALDMLKKVGLDEKKANQKVLTLSGGQQQRVAIARALVSKTDIILADEPTGNLDEQTSKDIIEIFKKLVYDEGKCVIMVTHNPEIARQSDVIYVVKDRKLTKVLKE